MAKWLFKTEPSVYSWSDMERDGTIRWSGITNNWALKFLRECETGDEALFYHTGNERQAMGIVEITSDPYPHHLADCDCKVEPNDKHVVVDVKLKVALPVPVKLEAIKADPRFTEFHLVKFSRLSALPVPEELWELLLEMGKLS